MHGCEKRLQAEIILLQDWIELVIVTPGTAVAEAEENLAGVVCNVVENEVPLTANVALIVFVDRVAEITGGDEHLGILWIDFVAGELLSHELIVRHVIVQRPDDPIAIRPRGGAIGILIVAVALGVADEIEPVLRPALT